MTRVQSTGKGSTTASNTLSVTFPSSPTVGNRIIVMAWGWWSGTTPSLSCADNQGNTYSLAVSNINTGVHMWCAIWWANVATTGTPFTVSITAANPTNRVIIGVAVEWSGLDASLDKTNTNQGNPGNPDTGATATTAQASELLTAVSVHGGTGTTIDATPNFTGSNPSSGWVNEIIETDNLNLQAGAAAYVTVNTTLAARHVWDTSIDEFFTTVIATWKAAGGGGGGGGSTGPDMGDPSRIKRRALRPRAFAPGLAR